jgi:hypothetical protein
MQPVETAPGFALVSEITGAVKEPDVSWTVPALIEFEGLVAVALRFDQVAVPMMSAPTARTATVAASLRAIPETRRPLRWPERASRGADEFPGAPRPGSSSVAAGAVRSSMRSALGSIEADQLVEDQLYSTVVDAPW